jgi:hypothetical protein
MNHFYQLIENLSPNKQALLALRLDKEIRVALDREGGGDKRLVAYVVPVQNGPLTSMGAPERLRAYLKRYVPDYMLPSSYKLLDTLPLTPNGKVDRKALSISSQPYLESELSDDYVAPRTDLEEELALTWAEILRVDQVGVHDNFFDLGGHSLLATQFISRVREIFQVELPLRTVFETPTVAGLAVAIVQYQVEQADTADLADIVEHKK